MMRAKKLVLPIRPMAFGELGAKQSQDDKPYRVLVEPVRTASVAHGFWSHSSLRSRRGSRLTATWPLLSGLNLARSIPARPFGLRLRFDGALLVARRSLAARSIKPTPQEGASIEQNGNIVKFQWA